jgi:hypothetical protein
MREPIIAIAGLALAALMVPVFDSREISGCRNLAPEGTDVRRFALKAMREKELIERRKELDHR